MFLVKPVAPEDLRDFFGFLLREFLGFL